MTAELRLQHTVYAFGVLSGLVLGALASSIIGRLGMGIDQRSLSGDQMLSDHWIPINIDRGGVVVVFDTPDEIRHVDRGVIAYTETNRVPCKIHMPNTLKIAVEPKDMMVSLSGDSLVDMYQNPSDYRQDSFKWMQTFEHELAHCFVPNWHDGWTAQNAEYIRKLRSEP